MCSYLSWRKAKASDEKQKSYNYKWLFIYYHIITYSNQHKKVTKYFNDVEDNVYYKCIKNNPHLGEGCDHVISYNHVRRFNGNWETHLCMYSPAHWKHNGILLIYYNMISIALVYLMIYYYYFYYYYVNIVYIKYIYVLKIK